jgi:membrane protein YqaA with SNARE-associated domain
MPLEQLLAPLGLYFATYAVCVVSALIPVVSAEVYLIGVGATLSGGALVPIALVAALGQMTGKACLYASGRGLLRLPLRRSQGRLERLHAMVEARKGRTGALLFTSALLGMPPFYALSIVSGMLRVHIASFLLLGFLGRALRFAAVILMPQLVLRGHP